MIKVGVIVLATGPYIQFVPDLLESLRKYFLVGVADVTPFILTDSQEPLPSGCFRLRIEHLKWPGVNMHRYHSIILNAEQYERMNYLFNFDADLIIKQPIGAEILGDVVGLISPTAWGWPVDKYLYERRQKSAAYIPYGQGKYFYNASISGGATPIYLPTLSRIVSRIVRDEDNGISAPWCHEEAYLNCEFLDHPPAISLTPDHCWPEGTHSLKRDFEKPIVMMRNKNMTLDKLKCMT